jgi:indolepyruvate ferredoxin oxidoreductase beta subunit
MNSFTRCQLVISGVGGQGVLFVTGLLAQAAMDQGFHVMTSETHGMAQRGGTVISHLKVGDFSSPLIRTGNADALIALKQENLNSHAHFLKPDGLAIVNSAESSACSPTQTCHAIDADGLAARTGHLRSVNLIVLGFTLAILSYKIPDSPSFCAIDAVRSIISQKMNRNPSGSQTALLALNAGYDQGLAASTLHPSQFSQ